MHCTALLNHLNIKVHVAVKENVNNAPTMHTCYFCRDWWLECSHIIIVQCCCTLLVCLLCQMAILCGLVSKYTSIQPSTIAWFINLAKHKKYNWTILREFSVYLCVYYHWYYMPYSAIWHITTKWFGKGDNDRAMNSRKLALVMS